MGAVSKRNPRGAGRPLSLAKQVARAETLARQLHDAASTGWMVLAREYPDLMELAINLARGGVKITRYDRDFTPFEAITEPNVVMLKTLIELLPKVLDEQSVEGTSPITELLRNLRTNVANIQVNVSMENDDDGRSENIERVTVEGVARALPVES